MSRHSPGGSSSNNQRQGNSSTSKPSGESSSSTTTSERKNSNDNEDNKNASSPGNTGVRREFRVASRAHRRAVHRRRNRSTVPPTPPASSAANSQEDDLEDTIGKKPTRSVSIVRSPRAHAASPYEPQSELEEVQLKFLTHHYVNVIAGRTVTPVGPRFEWPSRIAADDAFFHAVMASTASHASYLKRQVGRPPMFYYHRGKAIQLVNKRLSEGMDKAATEATINAIAMFTQQEGFEGRPEGSEMHINGLMALVRAAGGIFSPRLSTKTRRYVMQSDLAAAMAMNTKPILPPNPLFTDLLSCFGPPSPETAAYSRTFGVRLFNFTGDSKFSEQSAQVYWGLRNISLLLEDIHHGRASPDAFSEDSLQFTDRVEILERCIHPLWYVEPGQPEQHPVFRAFGYACFSYIFFVLRELPMQMAINTIIANRIRIILDGCSDLDVLLATFQDLFLWIMFLCGRVANPQDRVFFARQATKILVIKKIEDSGSVMLASESFLWPDRHPQIFEMATDRPRTMGNPFVRERDSSSSEVMDLDVDSQFNR